jgi:tetratricopeptide (TPR) repeat protein
MLREALAIEQQLPQPNRMRLAALRSRLAETLVLRHRTKECEQMLDMAIPLLHDVSETEELSIALNSLALVRRMQHRYSEAADLLLESVTALEKKYGPDHPLLLRSVSNLAVVYSLEGRNEDAKAQFEHASRICEAHVRPGHPTYMAFLENYAEFLRRTGDKKDAKAMQARARAMAQENPRSAEAMTVDVSAFRH